MRSILITGAAGFIGANFVHYMRHRAPNDRMVVLDALTYAGNRDSLSSAATDSGFVFVEGDICNEDLVARLFSKYEITHVVHFAAESHVDRSIVDPDAFLTTNVLGTHSLLKAARFAWAGRPKGSVRFHHVSTDEVYGSLGERDAPFRETTPYAPNSPYAASKAGSDHLVRAYHHTYGLPVTTTNCSNNYGPFQFPEKLIPLALLRMLRGLPVPVYGDGLNVRDWLYVEDHCRAIDLVLAKGCIGETYNVGGRSERRNLDLIRSLCAVVDTAVGRDSVLAEHYPNCPAAGGRHCAELISMVPDRPGHDRRYAIDDTKISQDLGFAPSVDLETGLKKTVDWYLANEPWWRRLLDRAHIT